MTISSAPLAARRHEVLARARSLVPKLRERAAETEALGKVHPDNVSEIIAAELMRACVPWTLGGYGLDRDVQLEVVMELGRGCGSTAWCTSIWYVHAWRALFFPKAFQDDFFVTGPDVLCVDTAIIQRQQVERIAGGWRISGLWSFGSGCDYSTEALLAVDTPDGPAWIGVTDRDFRIVDNWDVMGLRGTGSKDIALDDCFVPDHRLCLRADLDGPPWVGYELHHLPSLRVPNNMLLSYTTPSAGVGIAQSACDEFIRRLTTQAKSPKGAESVGNQLRIAEAQVAVDTAHTLLISEVRRAIAMAEAGHVFTPDDRIAFRSHLPFATALCVRAVSRLFEACGGHSLYHSEPIQRIYRDMIAASHHQTSAWDPAMEDYGRLLLNLPPGAGSRFASPG